MGRFGIVKRRVSEPDCIDCGLCKKTCRMGAVEEGFRSTSRQECIECMDCRAVCPEKAISFTGGVQAKGAPLDLSRRASFIRLRWRGSAGWAEAYRKALTSVISRPARSDEFCRRTRCAECMRVCIANDPAVVFEAGLLWSPFSCPHRLLRIQLHALTGLTGAIKRSG
jgi:ferredoxin